MPEPGLLHIGYPRWILSPACRNKALNVRSNLAGKIWSWWPASKSMPAFYRVLAVREPRPQGGAA
jgi:hypothetical protein